MYKLLLLVLWSGLLGMSALAQETRLALVIGQTEYSGDLSRVKLADHEAKLIEASLRSVGFEVTSRRDLSGAKLKDTLGDFRIRLERAGRDAVGFVYYTGHGARHPASQDSYLLGIDAKLRGASDLAAYGVDMKSQRDAFGATGAKAVFLVFDACRNTPAIPGWKASSKGLSRVEAASDMLIAYSTSLGDLAAEGVYAPVLAEELKRPGRSAEAAFAAAQRQVAAQTGREQLPWYNPLLYSEVCFAGCSGLSTSIAPPRPVLSGKNEADRQACDGGDMRGCVSLGVSYKNGWGVPEDFSEASRLYRQACDGGYMLGCFNMGVNYQKGKGVPEDLSEANRLYRQACDGGYMLGCFNMGVNYENGTGVPEDLSEANRLYRQACDGGEMRGCNSLGVSYQKGKGVPEDLSEANRLFRKACDGGNMLGCNNLGVNYKNGTGVPKDLSESKRHYRQACDGGYQPACDQL